MYIFILKGGKASGVISSLTHQRSPILSGGLEIRILMTVEHENVEIVARMGSLLECYSYKQAQEESESEKDDVNLIVPLIEELNL